MGGFFGVASREDCVADLFFGTDYHSHLGTRRGGMAVRNCGGYQRYIHDISNAQFRSKFEHDVGRLRGNFGIGVISDYEDQPLIIGSHLGTYAIVTVGAIQNAKQLCDRAFQRGATHFSEMSGGEINPTELVATLIDEEATFQDGIRNAQELIDGSCSILILAEEGLYVARDRFGRTPVVIGKKDGAWAAAMETSAFPNLGYQKVRHLGPGEVVRLTPDGIEVLKPPLDRLRICTFLWVYYGYPSSDYEDINVEAARNRCGAALARRETAEVDLVAGIPDSGTAHAIGYATEARLPYRRPFVKYTPTWPRSFLPEDPKVRAMVAKMKLLPIPEYIVGQRLLFCEDSIVRGTQLREIIRRLFEYGAREVHMRPACPPLIWGCRYLNFTRSRSELDLAARMAIYSIEGRDGTHLEAYSDPSTERYRVMVERIRERLGLTTLRYQTLEDLVSAIGLPAEKLCTYCWNGVG